MADWSIHEAKAAAYADALALRDPAADPPARPAPESIGYQLALTCPACRGPVAHTADGAPDGGTSRVVARCQHCGRYWLIEATIRDGTTRGTHGHRARPSHPPGCACQPCQTQRAA